MQKLESWNNTGTHPKKIKKNILLEQLEQAGLVHKTYQVGTNKAGSGFTKSYKLKFPAFKNNIISYVRKATKDSDVLSLFESLDGYIEFKDIHHVQKALEVNDPEKKVENQITDESVNTYHLFNQPCVNNNVVV